MTNIENKMPDDAKFECAISFFIGSCEAPEVDMWDNYDVIKSYALGYKKLYWDLLSSWAELKVKFGSVQEKFDQEHNIDCLKRTLRCLLSEEDTSENMKIQDRFIDKTIDAISERFHLILRTPK